MGRIYLLDALVRELGLVYISLSRQALDRIDSRFKDHAIITAHKLLVRSLERLQATRDCYVSLFAEIEFVCEICMIHTRMAASERPSPSISFRMPSNSTWP
jgi:hypothetical protein